MVNFTQVKGDRPVALTGLCDLAVLVEKERFRAFCTGLEDLMDLRIFILILDLMAAFLAADFALAQHRGLARLPAIGGVLTRDALIHHQIGGGGRADVEMLMQPESLAGAR